LEASHPDLYAFTDSAAWNQAVAHAYKGIENGDTYAGFSRKISQLLGSLKDSHTVLNFSDLLDYQIGEMQHILPMKIFSDSTGMYVREDMTGLIPAGAEIVSVNGVSAEELTQGLRDFSCAEGFSPVGTTRVADAIFYEVAGLLLPISRYNSVVICRTDSAESDTINYKALNDKEFDVMREVYFMDPRKQINRDFYLKIDRKLGLGILKVGSFAPPDNKKYTRFLDRSFEMLSDEQIPNMVIDLRGNMGGSSANVEELTSYLIEDGYNTPSNIIARQSELARSRSNRFVMAFSRFILRTFYRGNEDLQAYLDAMSLDNGEQDTLYFHEPLVQKKDLVFKGNKFLMINGLTASAGVDMTHAFKKHRIGTIVG
ncbi:MAG: hypothetical protein JNM00_16670, partial [Flavobacteriales bacterium]|nr:hypothetical protein [Flavobacteriales bacterium]